jgi:hypothetical protein
MYFVKNGLPTFFAPLGYYIDLDHSILTYVDDTGCTSDTSNGYYYYNNPYYLVNCIDNIVSVLPDDIYIISFKNNNFNIKNFIYEIKNSITNTYNGNFINIEDNKFYNKQIYSGTCSIGSLIITDDKILINSNNGWVYSSLLPLVIK